MCIADCKYDVVREAAKMKGWKLVNENPEEVARHCHVYWVDVPAVVERIQQLQRWQRINHFPGMSNVARKGRLAQNLGRMRRSFPNEFSFYPRTWVLPAEWASFKTEFDTSGKSTRTFIIKPDSGCQGRGIFLTQDLERVAAMDNQVAQLYVRRPLLIEGFKFDLRVYVLVTSVIPLRVYVFKDGLARFCTEEYIRPASDNLGERCMHLTNYAVNKGSDNFIANDGVDRDDLGSKRSLRWLLEWIAAERGQGKADALWRRMCGACVKTLISILPTLHREYLNTFGPDNLAHSHTQSSVCTGPGFACSNPLDQNSKLSSQQRDTVQGGIRRAPSPREGGTWDARNEDKLDGATACYSTGVGAGRQEVDVDQELDRSTGGAQGGDGDGATTGSVRNTDRDEKVEGSRCVEILGVDFMIDDALKPWLIEVNHLPSFATDSPLDRRIKSQIVGNALSVLHAKAGDRKSYEDTTKREAQNRLYNPDTLAAGSLTREHERKEAEAVVAKIRRKVTGFASEPRLNGLLSKNQQRPHQSCVM